MRNRLIAIIATVFALVAFTAGSASAGAGTTHSRKGETVLSGATMNRLRESAAKRKGAGILPKPALQSQGIPCTLSGCGDLTYHGGPIAKHPQLYFLLWGPKWQGETKFSPFLQGFASNLGVEDQYSSSGEMNADFWLAVTHQYGSGSGGSPWFYHNGVLGTQNTVGGFTQIWLDPSTPPTGVTQGQLGDEAVAFAHAQGIPENVSTDIVILPQQGTCPVQATFNPGVCSGTPGGACAYHIWADDGSNVVPFELMPYTPDIDQECTPFGNDKQIYSAAIGHETAEYITDPLITGWYDGNDSHEIADECPGYQTPDINGTSYTMQSIYSNEEADATSPGAGCSYQVSGVDPLGPIQGYGGVNCVTNDSGVSANGNPVTFDTCDTTASSGKQMFTNDSVSKTLDVEGFCVSDPSNGGPGTKVAIFGCNGTPQQTWTFVPSQATYTGHYVVNGSLCLTRDSTVGDQLTVQTCDGTFTNTKQLWTELDH